MTHPNEAETEQFTQQLEAQWGDRGRYFRGTYRLEGAQAILEGRAAFEQAQVNTRVYRPRHVHRYFFIDDQFGPYLEGKLLDVGSRDNTLKALLKKDATLVDKNNPNLPAFDWEKESLPFDDNSFDAVICLDTMEHIDRFHFAVDDLLRVSKRYVIISLPNCWRKMYKYMLIKGQGSRPSYGLPPEPPLDRHRWFFNTEDIQDFFYYQSAVSPRPFTVREIRYHLPAEARWQPIVYPLALKLLPRRFFKNMMVNTVFLVLEKKSS